MIKLIITAKTTYPRSLSKHVVDLLSKILNPNPKARISLEEIVEHPWIKK